MACTHWCHLIHQSRVRQVQATPHAGTLGGAKISLLAFDGAQVSMGLDTRPRGRGLARCRAELQAACSVTPCALAAGASCAVALFRGFAWQDGTARVSSLLRRDCFRA